MFVHAGYADPPSFDLGIEFQIQENVVKQGDRASASNTVTVGEAVQQAVRNEFSSVDGREFTTLGCTPASGKRKMDGLNWTTPVQKMKISTSPASMSKILADGVVYARMIQSEDELDMNVTPWDHDTTDSPVNKQVVVNCRIAKSPWFYGLTHRNCPKDAAERIFEQVMSMGETELERYAKELV